MKVHGWRANTTHSRYACKHCYYQNTYKAHIQLSEARATLYTNSPLTRVKTTTFPPAFARIVLGNRLLLPPLIELNPSQFMVFRSYPITVLATRSSNVQYRFVAAPFFNLARIISSRVPSAYHRSRSYSTLSIYKCYIYCVVSGAPEEERVRGRDESSALWNRVFLIE